MSRRGQLGLVAILTAAVIAGVMLVARTGSSCPDWREARRIELPGPFGDVTLDGTSYRIGATALLDYMPGSSTHGLGVTASVSAMSRDELGSPEFACIRATHGSEIWAARPTTFGIQTMADALPPGAPSPARNEAWRNAQLRDGPAWPAGDTITLELWLSVKNARYIFVVPPFALMKGG